MIVPIKMKDEDFEKIKTRTDDLIKFWSDWGYTDVETMPQYMQDIIKLIAHVEAVLKDSINENRIQEPPNVVDNSKEPPQPPSGVADTGAGAK